MSRIFTATLEAVNTNKSKTVIKLSLSNKEAKAFSARYLDSVDKDLNVTFEDPQLEMEMQPRSDGRPGLMATVNGRGEVEDVQRDADGGDGGGDLFSQEKGSFSDGSGDDEGNSRDPDPEDDELDFPEEGDTIPEAEADALPEDDGVDPEIDREKIEEYILVNEPVFDDIPFNFPMLLRRRREENITWMDLAREASTSSTRLQSFFQDYKKRVARKMKSDGVA